MSVGFFKPISHKQTFLGEQNTSEDIFIDTFSSKSAQSAGKIFDIRVILKKKEAVTHESAQDTSFSTGVFYLKKFGK